MIERIVSIAARLREPFIVVLLGIAAAPLAIGYLFGKARNDWGMLIAFPLCWLGFSWLFSSVLFTRVIDQLVNSYPSLAVTPDQVWQAWIAEAALVIFGMLLAQLQYLVNGGWQIGQLRFAYSPALVLALALPMVALIETTEIREGDPVRVLSQMRERLENATPQEIERFNYSAYRFLDSVLDEHDVSRSDDPEALNRGGR